MLLKKRMKEQNILIISKKWSSGRGPNTSVERFCTILDPRFESWHGKRIHVHPRISRFFKRRTNSVASPSYSAPYNSYSFELELWSLMTALKKRPQYVFFPYADYDYFYWQYFKNILRLKVILWTFFSRRELEIRFANLKHFAKADLVLAAGKDQMSYISEKIPQARVEFFPIGVDTEFFKSSPQHEQFRIIHAGNNRRDFTTLIRGLDLVYSHYPGLRVDLVGAYASRERIPARPYLTIHDFLNDQAYLDILNSCNFAILSLEDGGSSNSLLEFMAAGLPVVVTDLPNVSDYLDDSFALRFTCGSHDEMSTQCLRLLENVELRAKMSIASRAHSEKYSWNTLLSQFKQLLTSMD